MTPSNDPSQDSGSPAANDPAFGQRLMQAFDRIADLPETEREPALLTLCAEQPELEHALRALLARDAETGPLDATLSAQLQPLLREALPRLDPAPAQIGPYQVLRLLGEGGMGRVYLAKRSEGPVTREVAIKLIRPDRAGAGLLARFEAERRHLAALDHPGICRFIDADSLADGTPYVVMEAVQGEPIIDYCQRHALGLRERVELLRQLLAAVAHAHDRLLLHRDLKPHNVLVTAEGLPKLLDFGIAKSIEEAEASVTRTAERFFTPNASAPEQLLGQPAGVACDVYSLGALAYELLSGALPFAFKDLRAAEIERLILQVAPPLMSERSTQPWARDLRGDLDAIIATCLRKSPGERYRNVDALDAELQRWLEGRPVTARVPSWGYRSRLFVRRHRTAVGLSVALGLAVIVFGTSLALQAVELSEQRNLAVVERDRALEVVEILESAFRNADPSGAAGDGVTARQILDAATPGISALERANPDLFSRMAATLAKVELDVGNSSNAKTWVARGLSATGTTNESTNESVNSLLLTGAVSAAREGDYTASTGFLSKLLERGLGNTPEFMFANARSLTEQSQYVKAEEALRSLIKDLDLRNIGPEDFLPNEARWLLAEVLSSRHSHQRAAEEIERIIEWQLERLNEDHPRVLRSKILRTIYFGRMHLSPAQIDELGIHIRDLEQQVGKSSALLSRARTAYGSMLSRSNRSDEAIEQYEIAYPIIMEARGQDHVDTLRVAINYANALTREGSPTSLKKAIEVFDSVYGIASEKFRPEAPITHRAQAGLFYALIKNGEWDRASEITATRQFSTEVYATNARILQEQLAITRIIMESPQCTRSAEARCFPARRASDAINARMTELTKNSHPKEPKR